LSGKNDTTADLYRRPAMILKKTIGVISDTHGLIRPEVKDLFKDVDLIVHAGDIGSLEVLEELKRISPVVAVRGNCDRGSWAYDIPMSDMVEAGKYSLYVLHDIGQLDIEPKAAGVDIVIYGHSHRPEAFRKDGVLYLNPGSAGPKRFALPVGLAKLYLDEKTIDYELIKMLGI